MTDCSTAEIRDLLPGLVHDRLDAAARAGVEAHLRDCAECASELALLRALRDALGTAPRVDVAAIVATVPRYRTPTGRSWAGWRTAAAITVLVVGGSSVAVLHRGGLSFVDSVRAVPVAMPPVPVPPTGGPVPSQETAPMVTAAPAAEESRVGQRATRVTPLPAAPDAGRELAVVDGSLNDLNDRELASLLRNIESLDGLPSVEVESAALSPIAPGVSRRRAP